MFEWITKNFLPYSSNSDIKKLPNPTFKLNSNSIRGSETEQILSFNVYLSDENKLISDKTKYDFKSLLYNENNNNPDNYYYIIRSIDSISVENEKLNKEIKLKFKLKYFEDFTETFELKIPNKLKFTLTTEDTEIYKHKLFYDQKLIILPAIKKDILEPKGFTLNNSTKLLLSTHSAFYRFYGVHCNDFKEFIQKKKPELDINMKYHDENYVIIEGEAVNDYKNYMKEKYFDKIGFIDPLNSTVEIILDDVLTTNDIDDIKKNIDSSIDINKIAIKVQATINIQFYKIKKIKTPNDIKTHLLIFQNSTNILSDDIIKRDIGFEDDQTKNYEIK